MTHAQIAANARAPYAAKILRDQQTISELRAFVQHVADSCPDEAMGDDARKLLLALLSRC